MEVEQLELDAPPSGYSSAVPQRLLESNTSYTITVGSHGEIESDVATTMESDVTPTMSAALVVSAASMGASGEANATADSQAARCVWRVSQSKQ